MTSHLNSHRTTDIKTEMLSGVPNGNGNIIYVALPMREQSEKTTFSCKDDKPYIYIGVGSRDLFIDEAHTALGIFTVFF